MRQYRSRGKKRFAGPTAVRNDNRLGFLHLRPLRYEILEDRRLLSAWSLSSVQSAYDGGASAMAAVNQATAIANQLGLNVPLLNQGLNAVLPGFVAEIQAPFQTPSLASDTWSQMQTSLQNAGFTILYLPALDGNGDLDTDANNNLLVLTQTYTLAAPSSLTASGQTGSSYLDAASSNSLGGALGVTGPSSFTFQVTLGVDVYMGAPSFFIADSTGNLPGYANDSTVIQLNGLTASGSLSGSLSIANLASVTGGATATLTLTSASLGFTSQEANNKLRPADFGNYPINQLVTGSVVGSLAVDASLTATLDGLPSFTWAPTFNVTINWMTGNPNWYTGNLNNDFNLNPPTAASLLSGWLSSFSSLDQGSLSLDTLQSDLTAPLPLIGESVAQLTGLDGVLPDQAIPSNLQSLISALDADISGTYTLGPGTLTVNLTSVNIADLLNGTPIVGGLMTWTMNPISPSLSIDNGAIQTGCSYFDDAGGFSGTFTGTLTVTPALTVGVDSQGFYIAASNNILDVSGSCTAAGLTGSLDLGSLGTVDATATATFTLTADLGLTGSSELRLSDFQNHTAVVTASVTGTIAVNATLTANISSLPSVTWMPTFTANFSGSGITNPVLNLNPPSASSLFSSWVTSFFNIGNGIPSLGTLQSDLNQPLPIIDESIAQLTGLDNVLPDLPTLPPSLASYSLDTPFTIPLGPGTLSVNLTTSAITDLVEGKPADLISWETGPQSISLVNINETIPVFSFGIPDIASMDVDATFNLQASLNYDVGMGLDTHGFWIKAGSPSDPTVSLSFDASAGIEGSLEVLGFKLATAGGNIGLSLEPYVYITAPPYSANPDRVYLSDMALFHSTVVGDFLDALSWGIQGDLTGSLYASINLLVYKHKWSWGIDIPVFNFTSVATWPAQPGGSGGGNNAAAEALWFTQGYNHDVTLVGGTLTITGISGAGGSPPADNVSLSGGNDVTVYWNGAQSPAFAGVTKVDFISGAGNDQLSTASNFDLPVSAVGGPGDDYLQGGAAGNTLVAGSGNDTLVGGSGNNSIIGGAGQDLIYGGSGSDTLLAGTGDTEIYAGGGKSYISGYQNATPDNYHVSIYGGSGNDTIHGGSGYFYIDGGNGDQIIYGDNGYGLINGSVDNNDVIDCSDCSNSVTIYGGAGEDTIWGSKFPDTIYGGTGGNNVIHGGGGADLIVGHSPKGPGDSLYADGGDATIYGGAGNDTLYGGDGLGEQNNSPAGDSAGTGNAMLIAGSGSQVLYGDGSGQSTLIGGPGSDTLFAGSGGDLLVSGTGADLLVGGPGNDTIEETFTPSYQTPLDTVQGTGGTDTVDMKAAGPIPQLAAAIPDTTSTSITVTGAAVLQAEAFNQSIPFVILVDQEEMEVTVISGDTLTVTRGYNGTLAGIHSAGVEISVVPELAVAISSFTSTSVTVSDAAALTAAANAQGNFVIQIDTEQMLVTAVDLDTNTLTVTRGYNGTSAATHLQGALVNVPLPAIVAASPTLSAAIGSGDTSLTVSDALALTSDNPLPFIIEIDAEQMLVTAVLGNTLTVQRAYDGTHAAAHAALAAVMVVEDATLVDAVNSGATSLTISNADAAALAAALPLPFAIQIDTEQMLVTAVSVPGMAGTSTLTVQRAYNHTYAASHHASAGIVAMQPPQVDLVTASITVTNVAALQATADALNNFVIQVDNEQMLVTGVASNTLTVERGYNNTTATAHYGGATVSEPQVVVVDTPTLASPVETVLTVTNAAALAATAPFVIQVGAPGTPGPEQMLVTNVAGNNLTVERGYNNTAVAVHNPGAAISVVSQIVVPSPTLLNPITDSQTSITVSSAAAAAALEATNPLSPSFTISIDNEEMLVTNVAGDTLTVVRGYNLTTAAAHDAGAAITATNPPGVDDATATIDVTDAAALQAAAALAAGDGTPLNFVNFVVQVDSEQMLVTGVDTVNNILTVTRGYNGTTPASHAGGATLTVEDSQVVVETPTLLDPTLAGQTTLTVSSAAAAAALAATNTLPFVIQIDNEQMQVTNIVGDTLTVVPGYDSTTPAAHAAGAAIFAANPPGVDDASTTINVSNVAALEEAAGNLLPFVILIDSEQMQVTNIVGNTLTVTRGYNATTPAVHDAGAPVIFWNGVAVSAPTLVSETDPTSITVSSAAAAAALEATNPLPFTIQIDNEEMQVTNIVGDALTVVRGYDNTVVSDHTAGAAIVAANPPGVDDATTSIEVSNAAALAAGNTLPFAIQIDGEEMQVTGIVGNTLTVARGYDSTTPAVHDAGAVVSLAEPTPPPPPNYTLTLAQASGQYTAELRESGVLIGEALFDATGVAQVELDAGEGNDVLQIDSSVTLNALLLGGGGNDTLYGGAGDNTLVVGPGGPNTVQGGTAANTLVIQGDDQGDSISLIQSGPHAVSVSVPAVSVTATNITPVSMFGGAGNDTLDASAIASLPVTLDGADAVIVGGQVLHAIDSSVVSGSDTLIGGGGSNTFYQRPGNTVSGSGTVYNVTGQVDAAKCAISAPPNIKAGETVAVTLTARDANSFQETTGGLQVTFTSGPNVTFGAVHDNGNGTYTATFTATAPGAYTVDASDQNGFLTSKSITVSPLVPATLTASISPITPGMRNYAVGWVTIAFSAPVKGFTLADLELNGVALPSLTSTDPNQPALTLTSNDGQNWTLGNLAGYTCVYNSYSLKFNPSMISGITDYASDALSVAPSTSWLNINTSVIMGSGSGMTIGGDGNDSTKSGVNINYPSSPPLVYDPSIWGASSVTVLAATGDLVDLDYSLGNFLPIGGMTVTGPAVPNNGVGLEINFDSAPGDDTVTITSTQIFVNQWPVITYSHIAYFEFKMGTGNNTLIVNGVALAAPSTMSDGTNLILTNGGSFDLGGNHVIVTNLTGNGGSSVTDGYLTAYTGLVDVGTFIIGGGAVVNVVNTITVGGDGTLTVGGGGLQAGTLAVAGAVVFQAGSEDTLGGLSGSGTVAVDTDTLAINGTSGSTGSGTSAAPFSGVISGSGAVDLSGSATVTFAAANTYSGGTAIGPGTTLLLGDGGTNGSILGDVDDDGTLAFDRADDYAFDGAISGSGQVTNVGSGTLTIGNVNTFGGGDADGDVFGTVSIPQGEIDVIAGGVLTNNTSEIDVGDAAGLTGTLAMDGGSALTPWGSSGKSGVNVGINGGTGVVTLSGNSLLDASCTANSNGTIPFSNVVAIGLASSSGTVIVGGTSTLRSVAGSSESNGSFITVGEGGTGTLIVQDQGQVQAANFYVGSTFYGTSGGTGFLHLNGGTLSVPSVQNSSGTTGNLYFNGGTLQATASSSDFISAGGTLTAYVQSGGAVIDSNGNNITISQPLLHDAGGPAVDGGLTKMGPGSLLLAASNTYTGGTTVTGGTLIVNSAGGLPSGTALTVGAGGTFLFDPSVAAAPGATANTVALTPDVTTVASAAPASGSAADFSAAMTVEAADAIAPAGPAAASNAGTWLATDTNTAHARMPFQPDPVNAAAAQTARTAAFDTVLAADGMKRSAPDLAWFVAFEQQQAQNGSGDNDKPVNLTIDAVLARFGL